jgi:hypothetical protein
MGAARRAIARPRPEPGLYASLCDLSLRASLCAIASPLLVVAAWLATGRGGDDAVAADIPQPLFAFAILSFILVPMLALAGAVTGIFVAFMTAWRPGGDRSSAWRSGFLVALGCWAVVSAAYYDVAVIPVITR